MRHLILAGLLALGLTGAASAQRLSTHELSVANNSRIDLKHIYVEDLETGTRLGDRLVGKIPSRTSAVIDLTTAAGSCRMRLTAVFYDGDSVRRTMDICRAQSWTLTDSELDD